MFVRTDRAGSETRLQWLTAVQLLAQDAIQCCSHFCIQSVPSTVEVQQNHRRTSTVKCNTDEKRLVTRTNSAQCGLSQTTECHLLATVHNMCATALSSTCRSCATCFCS